MPSHHQLVSELAAIFSRPEYVTMLQRRNDDLEMQHEKDGRRASLSNPSFKRTVFAAKSATELAENAVKAALGEINKPKLTQPYVTELVPSQAEIHLYRLYDGISHKTALTLGSWWFKRALLEQIFAATSGLTGAERQARVLEFLRSAMFIHPHWNLGTNIARMVIPEGSRVPAIVGIGSWEAMKSERMRLLSSELSDVSIRTLGSSRSPGPLRRENRPFVDSRTSTLEIHSQVDVIDKLGMMPIPGFEQLFLPLFSDMWVCLVPERSPNWPFGP